MSKILELSEKRAKAWDAAMKFLETKRGKDDVLNAEDDATYNKMEAEVVALGKEIERLQRQAAIDASLAEPTSVPVRNKPDEGAGEAKTGRASDEYKKAFWNALRNKAVPGIQNALQVGTDSEGGYLVPDEFERTLIDGLVEENVFRKIAKVITTSNGDRKIPIVLAKGRASWVEEEGAIPESDDSFGQLSLSAHKLATMMKVSEELLSDSVFDLEGYIASEFARRIGVEEEDAFINGNGTGKPLGILADNGGAQIGVASTASGTTVSLDEIIDLTFSLKAPYRRKAVFLMNEATISAIRKLKDSTGQYLWQPSANGATPDTLMTYPLYTSPYMPTMKASAKSILFGDFSYYWVADRQGRTFRRLNELFAVTGQVGFMATHRVDGKLILPEAVKALKHRAT